MDEDKEEHPPTSASEGEERVRRKVKFADRETRRTRAKARATARGLASQKEKATARKVKQGQPWECEGRGVIAEGSSEPAA